MLTFLLFFTQVVNLSLSYQQFLSHISGEVKKENFTYYSIIYDGTILIELISVTGDCDLYVSQKTLKPNFESDSNCLQSVTCGIDRIIVPKSFKRPIGIGVFGHPFHEVSFYHLMFYRVDDSRDIFNYEGHWYQKGPEGFKFSSQEESEDSESDSFYYLRVFLKILLQVLIELIQG